MSGKQAAKKKFSPRNPESGISGEGYGASHNWKNGGTTAGRCTLWTCGASDHAKVEMEGP